MVEVEEVTQDNDAPAETTPEENTGETQENSGPQVETIETKDSSVAPIKLPVAVKPIPFTSTRVRPGFAPINMPASPLK